jgi:ATP-binding cassette subfamily B protein
VRAAETNSTLRLGITAASFRYGRPSASEDEIIGAAKAAQIWPMIAALPHGLDTKVGEAEVQVPDRVRIR